MDPTVPSPAVELPRPGDVVCGKYRIEGPLGHGGMGVVLAATDTSLGRAVAIKLLPPHKSSSPDAVARFLREARAAAAIQSEHVVRVFEVDTFVTGTPFIVMERLVGADLAQVLEDRGPMPIDVACDTILQACQALGEAHRLGIVHRDLKPGNLFVAQRPDGTTCLKVLDFGISKGATFEAEGGPSLTSTGAVMGTPLYMSPEQLRSLRDADARTDIWALGAILFELLTRSLIYEAETASALCAMIAMDPPIPLRARLPSAPIELEAIILRCLHKDPAGRFQDVAALADALAPYASDRGRLSVEVVSRVVRGSSAPLAFGRGSGVPPAPTTPRSLPPTLGNDTTVDAPIFRDSGPPLSPPFTTPSGPPLAFPAPPPSAPTTQVGWQQPSAPPSGGRLGLALGLGAVAVVVVGGAGAGYVYTRRPHRVVTEVDVFDAGVPRDAPAAAAPLEPAPAPVPAPPLSAMKPEHKDAAAKAEAGCRAHNAAMNRATTDSARERAARSAKTASCHGGASSRCERLVCLTACTTLHDAACVQEITDVIDHGPPPKY
jgi:serine/threonine-protein kinase